MLLLVALKPFDRAFAAITVQPWVPVFRGIEYASGEADTNEVRLQKVFALRIDLQDPTIELYSTPRGGPLETIGQTTTTFVNTYGVKVGVNANFFSPVSTTPNDPRTVLGLAISRGDIVSAIDNRPVLVITSNNVATIAAPSGINPTNFWTGVAGSDRVLINGVVQSFAEGDFTTGNHPRTAVGTTQNGRYLIMLVIDGRQPTWSIGAPLSDVGQWLVRFGCYQGLNLDGGGSTAMAKLQTGSATLLNKPSGGVQRVNGNHIGAFSQDIAPVFVQPPADTIALAGDNVVLAPLAGGTTPLRYQWRFGGTNIAGATKSSLTISNAAPAHTGTYTLTVSNHVGVISGSASLNVNYALSTNAGLGGVITKSPNTASHAPGSTVTVQAIPDPGFVFTGWSGALTGTNNPATVTMTGHKSVSATFTGSPTDIIIDNPQATLSGTWSTATTGTDKFGNDYRTAAASSSSVRTAAYRPTIYTPGKYAVYAWYPSGTGRATNAPWTVFYNGGSHLTRMNQNLNGGRWNLISGGHDFVRGTIGYVILRNTNSALVVADAVKFVYGIAPSIVQQPQSATVIAGQTASFQVSATGTDPLGYQWFRNGTPLANATASSFSLPNAQPANAGTYSVLVTNLFGAIGSSDVQLVVNVPPSITSQPSGQSVAQGTDVTFSVTASGTAPLSFQWFFNGAVLPGATANSLALQNVQTNHGGTYFLCVTNVAGATFSSNIVLAVDPTPVAPTLKLQPASRVAIAGTNVLLEARATGTLPLRYQWRLNGSDLLGATNATLFLGNVQPSHAGNYTVRVSNQVGAATSTNASLAVHFSLSATSEVGGMVSQTPLQNSYLPGSTVSLTATADSNFTFAGWRGSFSSTNNPLAITLQSNCTLMAQFSGAVNDIVVDNPAANYFGAWTIGTTASGKYGADYHFASTSSSNVTATATYRPNITTPGKYNIYIMYPAGSNRASNAPWQTVSAGDSRSVIIDQMTGGGTWQLISGVHHFDRGTNGYVQLANTANNSVVMADAVRWAFIYPPEIVNEPTNRVVRVGSNVVFNVNVTGAAPLSYQWFFNDTPIPGGTGSAYLVGPAQVAHTGRYSVQISNVAGVARSWGAKLTVVPFPVPLRLQSVATQLSPLRFAVEAGLPLNLAIETSTNLVHWSVVTNLVEVMGVVEWMPDVPATDLRFYRARVTE